MERSIDAPRRGWETSPSPTGQIQVMCERLLAGDAEGAKEMRQRLVDGGLKIPELF